MKYLQDFMEDRQTKLFKKTGAIFAFSNKQFLEQRKLGISYVNLKMGLFCPKDQVETLINNLYIIYKESIQEDLKENEKIKIIKRELSNYECYYTGDITDVIEKLEDYNISKAEIIKVFNKERLLDKYY